MRHFDAVDEMRLAASRQKDTTFSVKMTVNRYQCFICGSRKQVKEGLCTACREDFPVKEQKEKSEP